jgi:hypothetical protein
MPDPQRIQLSRKPGYRKPEGAVVVSRPGKWGNPYAGDRAEAVELFTVMLAMNRAGSPMVAYPSDAEIRAEIGGRDLACWCPVPDAPGASDVCHGAALLKIANQETEDASG